MKIRKWLLLIAMITSFNSLADLGPGFFKDAKNNEVAKMKELRDVWSSLSQKAHPKIGTTETATRSKDMI